MEYYNYIKSLHLIFVITWFAGLFYIPRLFIYHIEAQQKPNPESTILSEQLKLMARRLWYIITCPSAILAIIFALWLLHLAPYWLQQQWMQVKLVFVISTWTSLFLFIICFIKFLILIFFFAEMKSVFIILY